MVQPWAKALISSELLYIARGRLYVRIIRDSNKHDAFMKLFTLQKIFYLYHAASKFEYNLIIIEYNLSIMRDGLYSIELGR